MLKATSAIIAGTGVYQLPGLNLESHTVGTPFGPATVHSSPGHDFVFLTRHGADHSVPPHRINYRANMSALKILGVRDVLATYAVGSLRRELGPGGLTLLTDFLDFTRGREQTYFEGGTTGLGHTDMSQPYCPQLNALLLAKAFKHNLEIAPQATYACTNGPRFESAAEVRMLAQLGGHVVGMTGLPEVSLAKELGLHFAAVALSINWAVGLEEKLTMMHHGLTDVRENLVRLFIEVLGARSSAEREGCGCESAVDFLYKPSVKTPGLPQPGPNPPTNRVP